MTRREVLYRPDNMFCEFRLYQRSCLNINEPVKSHSMGSVPSFVFPAVHLFEHYRSFMMVESSFIFKHCRGPSECTKCVLLWSSSSDFHQQPMGICFGRYSSTKHKQAVHPFSPNESTSNHQVHVIRKRFNPELKLQCYGTDRSIKTNLSSFLATSHTNQILNADHAGRGAAYRIKVRIPSKQLSGIFPRGNMSKEEALATFLIQKHGARLGVKHKACFNSWRPSLESISEEEPQTNDQNR